MSAKATMTEPEASQYNSLYPQVTETSPQEPALLSTSHRSILIPTLPSFSFYQASGAHSSTTSRRRCNLRSGCKERQNSDVDLGTLSRSGSSDFSNITLGSQGQVSRSGRFDSNPSRVHPCLPSTVNATVNQGRTDVLNTPTDTMDTTGEKSINRAKDSRWDDALRRIKIRTFNMTSPRIPVSASARHYPPKTVPPVSPKNNLGSSTVYPHVPSTASHSSSIVREYNDHKGMPPYDEETANEGKNIQFALPATSTSPQQTRYIKITESTASKTMRNLLRQELTGEKPVSLFIEGEKLPFHVKTFFPLVQEGGQYLLEFAQLSWAEEQMLDLQGAGKIILSAGRFLQKHKVA